jgi:GDP-L-fucose synthase
MRKIRVLLTGGGGMVGRNILEHPNRHNFEFLAPRSDELDLRDFDAINSYLRAFTPDIVIHAAGKVGGIQANIREPVGFLMDNLDMGRNIIWASYKFGIDRIINLGSSCMYPRNHTEALREELVLTGQLEPTNEGYALAKIVTARLCDYIMREDSRCQYKTLIPCNIYGRYDKFDPAQSHLLPAIISKVHHAKLVGQESVEIWGDGTARREFMYAGDLADVLLRAITNFDTLPSCMNVGLGFDYTINEYYQAAAEVLGYTGGFIHDIGKPVGMARKLVCVERQTAWGWSARHDLHEGIERTYAYFLKDCQQ